MSTSLRAAVSATPVPSGNEGCSTLCAAVSRGLRELACVLRRLNDQQYTTPVAAIGTSPIGAHVRHAVDHVTKLIECINADELDYDQRRRGTAIEANRADAINAVDDLVSRVGLLARLDPNRSITVHAVISVDGPSVSLSSTLGREIAFVMNHTIHHNAVIASMARAFRCELPEGFGWAPSTLRHAVGNPCAQ